MAWLELPPSGVYHVAFRIDGRKCKRSLETGNPQLAEKARLRVAENLRLVEQGRLDVPDGIELSDFLLYDGRLTIPQPHFVRLQESTGDSPTRSVVAYRRSRSLADGDCVVPPTHSTSGERTISCDSPSRAAAERDQRVVLVLLGAVLDEYIPEPIGSTFVPESLRVARVHATHLKRILGADTPMSRLDKNRLQDYVIQREKCNGRRGKPLSPTTIKKELGTLSSVWTKVKGKYVIGEFPGKDLEYSRTASKARFQTREQIERQIVLGGLSAVQQAELWDSLFLTANETTQVLTQLAQYRGCDFLYPMVVMAAHTGARRSELCRSLVGDFDLDGSTVVIHEKKRVKGTDTTRSVPISPTLRNVINDWFKTKRRSSYTFPRELKVQRSRRSREHEDAVSVDEASHHLLRALANSQWDKIRGWHIFRHSFCSNCAAAGVDQRIINEWTGHSTDEMVRRYRHLIPSQEQAAIGRVFN